MNPLWKVSQVNFKVTWASDCDISVEVKGLKASVLDLFINGHIRVVLKPIIPSLPLVGGVQVRVDFHKVKLLIWNFNGSAAIFPE